MATAMHFSEANAAFSVYGRPTIPLLIRPQGTDSQQANEFVSVWYFDQDELLQLSETGLLYVRLLGDAPFARLVRLYVWDASPIEFDGQTVGQGHPAFGNMPVRLERITLEQGLVNSTLLVWQLSETGWETALITNYVVLSMIGDQIDCSVTARRP